MEALRFKRPAAFDMPTVERIPAVDSGLPLTRVQCCLLKAEFRCGFESGVPLLFRSGVPLLFLKRSAAVVSMPHARVSKTFAVDAFLFFSVQMKQETSRPQGWRL